MALKEQPPESTAVETSPSVCQKYQNINFKGMVYLGALNQLVKVPGVKHAIGLPLHPE